MIGRLRRSLYENGSDGTVRVGVPKVWSDAMGLKKGDVVEVVFDDILVVIPQMCPQAERVLKAMREVR